VSAMAPRPISLAISGAVQDALTDHFTEHIRELHESGADVSWRVLSFFGCRRGVCPCLSVCVWVEEG
jgi:hypothetical protein